MNIPTDELESNKDLSATWVNCGVRENSVATFIFAQYYVKPDISLDENECKFINSFGGEITTGCFIKPKAGADVSFFNNNINSRSTLNNEINALENSLSSFSGSALTQKQAELDALRERLRGLRDDYIAQCYIRSR